jgi:nucleoside phosphorylase
MVTALRQEYSAVRDHLTSVRETRNARGLIWDVVTFASKGCVWSVGLVQLLEPGNEAAQHFRPQIVMFVGIAGGVNDALRFGMEESSKSLRQFLSAPDNDLRKMTCATRHDVGSIEIENPNL